MVSNRRHLIKSRPRIAISDTATCTAARGELVRSHRRHVPAPPRDPFPRPDTHPPPPTGSPAQPRLIINLRLTGRRVFVPSGHLTTGGAPRRADMIPVWSRCGPRCGPGKIPVRSPVWSQLFPSADTREQFLPGGDCRQQKPKHTDITPPRRGGQPSPWRQRATVT